MAHVVAVCRSEVRGICKSPAETAQVVAGHGLEGDAHAGPGHRQVSLLAQEAVDAARALGLDVGAGAFGENLVSSGLDTEALGLGSRIRVGVSAELELTQRGKICHDPCAIQEITGECIMPKAGLFFTAVQGGPVRPGDAIEIRALVPRALFQVGLVTVSDRSASGERPDETGPALKQMVEEALQSRVADARVVPDDIDQICQALIDLCERGLDLILTAGGTGFAPRDVTPEATRQVVERLAPGLDEAMRAASLRVTPRAMLSRGISGTRGATLIVNLPGSPQGSRENLGVLIPVLPHALGLLRGTDRDCGGR